MSGKCPVLGIVLLCVSKVEKYEKRENSYRMAVVTRRRTSDEEKKKYVARIGSTERKTY